MGETSEKITLRRSVTYLHLSGPGERCFLLEVLADCVNVCTPLDHKPNQIIILFLDSNHQTCRRRRVKVRIDLEMAEKYFVR